MADVTTNNPSEPVSLAPREFSYPYVVMWSDIDQFQHMSFANYLKLMYLSCDGFFLDYYKRHPEHFEAIRISPFHSQMQFKDQSNFGDRILIEVHSANVALDGFDLYYVFRNQSTSKLIALGKQSFSVSRPMLNGRESYPDSLLECLVNIQSEIPYPFHEMAVSSNPENTPTTLPTSFRIFTFDKFVVFFKHTNHHGTLHFYNFLEWTSYVREAYFQATVDNFKQVLERHIKMMTTRINSTIFCHSEFGDTFEARLTVGKIKKASFDMIVRFYNQAKKKIACETVHTVVFVDSEKETFANIPEEMRRVILHYQEPSRINR